MGVKRKNNFTPKTQAPKVVSQAMASLQAKFAKKSGKPVEPTSDAAPTQKKMKSKKPVKIFVKKAASPAPATVSESESEVDEEDVSIDFEDSASDDSDDEARAMAEIGLTKLEIAKENASGPAKKTSIVSALKTTKGINTFGKGFHKSRDDSDSDDDNILLKRKEMDSDDSDGDDDDSDNDGELVDASELVEEDDQEEDEEEDEEEEDISEKPAKRAKINTDIQEKEDDINISESEDELYDWKIRNEEEEAEEAAARLAIDIKEQRLGDANKRREELRKQVVQERQRKAHARRVMKRRRNCLNQKLAIRPNYLPHRW